MEFKIKIKSREEKIQAQIIGKKLWCHWNGETFAFDLTEGKKKSGTSSSGDASLDILSPMPGKVTKIFFQKGQKVERGQAVMVMEAMKMEYTLKAEISGVIAEMNAQIGQQVTLGEKLVSFEENTPNEKR